VAIGLVTYVPYDAILWGVIDIVQSHRNFGHAKAGSQVARVDGQLLDDVFS
jgi:hypothetical protein